MFKLVLSFSFIFGIINNSPIQHSDRITLNIEFLNSVLITGDVNYFKNYAKLCESQIDYGYCLENAAWLGHTRLLNYLMTKSQNTTTLENSLKFAVWRGHQEVVQAILQQHYEMQGGIMKKSKTN